MDRSQDHARSNTAVTSGHTPGPWVAGPTLRDHSFQPLVMGPHFEIATCWHHCVGSLEEQAHANAQLIAAAPDLLEAARAAEAHLRASGTEVWALLADAIAKATGAA